MVVWCSYKREDDGYNTNSLLKKVRPWKEKKTWQNLSVIKICKHTNISGKCLNSSTQDTLYKKTEMGGL